MVKKYANWQFLLPQHLSIMQRKGEIEVALVGLTIGGSDSWGGGGVATDLKTFENHQVFGLMAITTIAIADAEDGFSMRSLPEKLLYEQLNTIEKAYEDRLSVIKIGLLMEEHIEIVERFLKKHTKKIPIVLDPVLAFKETQQQAQYAYIDKLKTLFQYVDVLTPNLIEANLLLDNTSVKIEDLAIELFKKYATATVVKGGSRLEGQYAEDVLAYENGLKHLTMPKLSCGTINGAGCCFSTAISCQLARKLALVPAVMKAKRYVYHAIEKGILLENQTGNVWHEGHIFIEDKGENNGY